ncbi:MAG: AI-2E family transporter, partial [Proteobacteria bacterium]|nr:AI-2E family transporter [Pseudomonadota bacterium]
ALGNIGGKIASTTSAFLLSLLFSFLIVLDLPQLGASVRALESTKLRFIYRSVAGNIHDFSQVLGKALEAQLIIAIINSILTAVGITLLGLSEQVAFLSVIVFFCSFFPVIGVFISSIPICLIALQTAGLQVMLLAILLIAIIHLVEGYILNPRIYGSYMRINSVIILIILTIGGKLFDFWGLILGVPICTYVFGHAIRLRKKDESEPLPPATGE